MCNFFAGMRHPAAVWLSDIPPVLIIYVVSVLPHIHGEQGGLPVHQGGLRIGRLGDLQLAVLALHQPGPAAAKLSCARSLELFLELVQRAEGLIDGCLELTLGLL